MCHAYQILKKGGLKDENIVVLMYDDIANSPENPRRGVVINHPKGKDIYHGVPKELLLPSYWVFPFLIQIRLMINLSCIAGLHS